MAEQFFPESNSRQTRSGNNLKRAKTAEPYITRVQGNNQADGHIVSKGRLADPTVKQRKRRLVKLRETNFREAALSAWEMDWPLTMAITISWNALLEAGEQNEGHCLAKADADREAYVRTELRRLATRLGLEFVLLYGREVGTGHGIHAHFYQFLRSRHLDDLVALLERVTGSPAEYVVQPYTQASVARSTCGGWQIDINTRLNTVEGVTGFADYLTKWGAAAPPAIQGKAYGVSQSIGPSARARHHRGTSRRRPTTTSTRQPHRFR